MQRHRLARVQPKQSRRGEIKFGILAWLLGLPLPIVILALFYKGCDF